MEDLEIARACALYADDKKAENIRILDLRGLSPISDYFVLVTAMSTPQLRAVRDEIVERIRCSGCLASRFARGGEHENRGWNQE